MRYQGDRFSVDVPDDWVDRTVYSFQSPLCRGQRACVSVAIDPAQAVSPPAARTRERVAAITAEEPVWVPVREDRFPTAEGGAGALAELRWAVSQDVVLYRRLYFGLAGGCAFAMLAAMDTHVRARLGGTVDRIAHSLRAPDAASPAGDSAEPPAPDETPQPVSGTMLRFAADRFVLDRPAGWESTTVYMLAGPVRSGVQRNLVVRCDRAGEPAGSPDERARTEAAELAATISGFELIEHGEVALVNGRPAARVVFLRSGEGGLCVRQTEIQAPEGSRLYTICLTTEATIPEAEALAADEIARSFTASAVVDSISGH